MMKKFLIALLLAIGTTTLFAQDIIITKESGRIDAQVLEISDYEISYKMQSNPNGPVLKIEANKVASILFANGDVYSPKNVVVTPTPKTDGQNEDFDIIITRSSERISAQIIEISDTVIIYKLYGNTNGQIYNIKASDVDYIVFANGETYYPEKESTITITDADVKEEKPVESFPITLKTGKVIMFKPGLKLDAPYYGEYKLTGKEVFDLMRQTCPDAYKTHRKVDSYALWGLYTIVVGSGALAYGLSIDEDKNMSNKLKGQIWKGLGGIILGFGGTLLSFSFSIASKPYAIFNEQCGNPNYKPPKDLSLSLSLSPANVGLTLNF